jgi:hypothetical protein
MADTKISALPAATTPLAGTEVLPIVQGGVTEKVAVDDLTVRNFRANATTGILQVTGPAAASTRVMTVPDASFTAARTDAAQSFTGDQTLSTGNLIIGTSGQGIDFSATPGAGTSELFSDYEEGTWTPSFLAYGGGSSLPTFTDFAASGRYTKIGRQVFLTGLLSWTARSGGAGFISVDGLPFTISPHTMQGDMEFDEAFGSSLGVSEAIWKAGLKPRTWGTSSIARFKFGYASGAGTNVVTDLECTNLLNATVRMRFSLIYTV